MNNETPTPEAKLREAAITEIYKHTQTTGSMSTKLSLCESLVFEFSKSEAARQYWQEQNKPDLNHIRWNLSDKVYNYLGGSSNHEVRVWHNIFELLRPYLTQPMESKEVEDLKAIFEECKNDLINMANRLSKYEDSSSKSKIVFIIDDDERSPEYSPMDLFIKTEEDILSDMEECTCTLTESNNHCECESRYEESKITGYEIISGSKESDAVEWLDWYLENYNTQENISKSKEELFNEFINKK